VIFVSDLRNFGMGELMVERVFEFCDFYPILKRGSGSTFWGDFLISC